MVKFSHSSAFWFTYSSDVDIQPCHFLLDHVQFTLIHGPNIPGSYVILFFLALDFTFTTKHIHSWVSFLLWPSCFILSGAISNFPLLFLSSILDTFQPGGLIFQCHIFYHTVMVFPQQEYWSGLPPPPPVEHVLSELSTMTCLSCVVLHHMAHGVIELCKPFAMTMLRPTWTWRGWQT